MALRYVTKQDVYNTNFVWLLHGFHPYNTKKDLDNVWMQVSGDDRTVVSNVVNSCLMQAFLIKVKK